MGKQQENDKSAFGFDAEMSGLSYFAIQIQSWILKTHSKSKPSPKCYQNTTFYWQQLRNSCPLTHSKSCPGPQFVQHFAVRLQSKFNKIRHSPDPVQSKSSPMLISGLMPLVLSLYNHVDPIP